MLDNAHAVIIGLQYK